MESTEEMIDRMDQSLTLAVDRELLQDCVDLYNRLREELANIDEIIALRESVKMSDMRYTFAIREGIHDKLNKLFKINKKGKLYITDKKLLKLPAYCQSILDEVGNTDTLIMVDSSYKSIRDLQYINLYEGQKSNINRYAIELYRNVGQEQLKEIFVILLNTNSSIYCLPIVLMKYLSFFLYYK